MTAVRSFRNVRNHSFKNTTSHPDDTFSHTAAAIRKYRIWISFWDARIGHETVDRCARACVCGSTSHYWQLQLSWLWCRMFIVIEILCMWSEVSYCEVLRDKSTMYIRVTLYWGTWLYCDCFIWCVSCAVVVLTCFVMCGCVYVWVL